MIRNIQDLWHHGARDWIAVPQHPSGRLCAHTYQTPLGFVRLQPQAGHWHVYHSDQLLGVCPRLSQYVQDDPRHDIDQAFGHKAQTEGRALLQTMLDAIDRFDMRSGIWTYDGEDFYQVEKGFSCPELHGVYRRLLQLPQPLCVQGRLDWSSPLKPLQELVFDLPWSHHQRLSLLSGPIPWSTLLCPLSR